MCAIIPSISANFPPGSQGSGCSVPRFYLGRLWPAGQELRMRTWEYSRAVWKPVGTSWVAPPAPSQPMPRLKYHPDFGKGKEVRSRSHTSSSCKAFSKLLPASCHRVPPRKSPRTHLFSGVRLSRKLSREAQVDVWFPKRVWKTPAFLMGSIHRRWSVLPQRHRGMRNKSWSNSLSVLHHMLMRWTQSPTA